MVEKEKIPLLIVYKQDGKIHAEFKDETKKFELYGFLKCYNRILEEELLDGFQGY